MYEGHCSSPEDREREMKLDLIWQDLSLIQCGWQGERKVEGDLQVLIEVMWVEELT